MYEQIRNHIICVALQFFLGTIIHRNHFTDVSKIALKSGRQLRQPIHYKYLLVLKSMVKNCTPRLYKVHFLLLKINMILVSLLCCTLTIKFETAKHLCIEQFFAFLKHLANKIFHVFFKNSIWVKSRGQILISTPMLIEHWVKTVAAVLGLMYIVYLSRKNGGQHRKDH